MKDNNILQQYFTKNDIVSGITTPSVNSNNPDKNLNLFEVSKSVNKIFENFDDKVDKYPHKKNQLNMNEVKLLYSNIMDNLIIGSPILEKGPIEHAINKSKITPESKPRPTTGKQIESFVEGGYGGNINEKELVIEGFENGGKCCPQGFDLIDGECKKVCINCKYNNCDTKSHNIGQVYNYENNKKALENKKSNDDVLEYIFSEINN